jgi:hypothetical protein
VAKNRSMAVGSASGEFLRADPFRSLVIEVHVMEGAELSNQTLSDIRSFLGRHLEKPDGIEIVRHPPFTAGRRDDRTYSIENVLELERQLRTFSREGSRLAAFVLVLDGRSTSANALAHAYSDSSTVLYSGRISEMTVGMARFQRIFAEMSILRHEFGHLMGLVNIGVPASGDHHDHAHGAHCRSESCVMFYQVNSPSLRDSIPLFGPPPDFDEACLADIAAAKALP